MKEKWYKKLVVLGLVTGFLLVMCPQAHSVKPVTVPCPPHWAVKNTVNRIEGSPDFRKEEMGKRVLSIDTSAGLGFSIEILTLGSAVMFVPPVGWIGMTPKDRHQLVSDVGVYVYCYLLPKHQIDLPYPADVKVIFSEQSIAQMIGNKSYLDDLSGYRGE